MTDPRVPVQESARGCPRDVLAFVTRAMDRPPLLIDLAARRFSADEVRDVQAELRYVKERRADLATQEALLWQILRLKERL